MGEGVSGEHLSREVCAQVHGKGESEGEGMCPIPGIRAQWREVQGQEPAR